MRTAKISRKTKETAIDVEIDLDGTGTADISTGIGFLDHMLDQLARHSLCDMKIKASGDLHIDLHHTTEDTGICLGQAISKALGDRRGIGRFADCCLAMDEALSRAVIDVSGRPHLVWKVQFASDKVGEMDTELFQEFFAALVHNAKMTLHIENLYGVNTHHIVESCFKATARALREAVSVDARQPEAVPSTKGSLLG